MTTPTYKKPRKIDGVFDQNTDKTTREFKLLEAYQLLGVPSALLVELTGIKATTLTKIFDNHEVVPLENIKATNRCLEALALLQELGCLPTTDYTTIRSVLGLGYVCKNAEDDIYLLKERLDAVAT
jgi:hypothetical protein